LNKYRCLYPESERERERERERAREREREKRGQKEREREEREGGKRGRQTDKVSKGECLACSPLAVPSIIHFSFTKKRIVHYKLSAIFDNIHPWWHCSYTGSNHMDTFATLYAPDAFVYVHCNT
jgi:hypothetical protein